MSEMYARKFFPQVGKNSAMFGQITSSSYW